MASKRLPSLLLPITTILLFCIAALASSSSVSGAGEVAQWCDGTPHPHVCRYYLTNVSDPPKRHSEFYRLIVKISYELSLRAQSHLKRLEKPCRAERQRSPWLDCWRLYSTTVVQLNRTLNGGCSPVDAQTWLSAALTNLQTCHNGFREVGASPNVIHPLSRYNVTDLISNCLAINTNASSAAAPAAPPVAWTAAAGRRLLQFSPKADLVVSRTEAGRLRSVKAALTAAALLRKKVSRRIVIYVKAGVYRENVQIVNSLSNITIVGDGIGKTIITGSRSMANGYTTFSSATFSVFGDGFIASGITFRNTYGRGSQAVALLSGSDRSVFYKCGFEGYQDTLCVFSQRQFYKDCDIYGTIDFIFGNAAAVFQGCNIYARRPTHGEAIAITAQGRIDPNQNTGIVVQFSTIRAGPDLETEAGSVKSYLGRPWQPYSRTVFMQSYISGIIDPAGWLPFNGNVGLSTLYYAEFKNTGPGSRMSKRVRWPGYHAVARASVVQPFTVSRFVNGRAWLPGTGVPFQLGF